MTPKLLIVIVNGCVSEVRCNVPDFSIDVEVTDFDSIWGNFEDYRDLLTDQEEELIAKGSLDPLGVLILEDRLTKRVEQNYPYVVAHF